MKVGFVGLGKLGLPVSVAMCNHTRHEFHVYDLDAEKMRRIFRGETDLYEPLLVEQLRAALDSGGYLANNSIAELVAQRPDLIFIAVPTPTKKDSAKFSLGYVEQVVEQIGVAARSLEAAPVVAVISTMLPGDTRRSIAPIYAQASGNPDNARKILYNASFIAMGTTVADFLSPEFVLIGESDPKSGMILEEFYKSLYSIIYAGGKVNYKDGESTTFGGGVYLSPPNPPILHMAWEEAELTKMAYNTYIGQKIVMANTLMEICHKIGNANVDVVTNALSKATKRLVSTAYMRGGMGDGGGCHPRDNFALAELAEELHLSTNPFEYIMSARLQQARWIAGLLMGCDLPIVLMGKRYKPNTNLTDYSVVFLVETITWARSVFYDPLIGLTPTIEGPHFFLISHTFDFVHQLDLYPKDSIIIDPWRCFSTLEVDKLKDRGVKYVPLGVS